MGSLDPHHNLEEMSSKLLKLEAQIESLHERNRRVELAKAWETSKVRLIAITFIIYVTMVLVFFVLHSVNPWAEALVPTTGFFLSTLSLSFVRSVWEKKRTSKP